MVKTPYKHLGIFVVALVILVFVGNITLGLFLAQKKESRTQVVTPTPTQTQPATDTFSYQGETGKDALTILKEKTTVGEEASGLVVSINGRKADSTKHEYWAFYVNGQLAQVGPADYKTKSGDKIEWKIETY